MATTVRKQKKTKRRPPWADIREAEKAKRELVNKLVTIFANKQKSRSDSGVEYDLACLKTLAQECYSPDSDIMDLYHNVMTNAKGILPQFGDPREFRAHFAAAGLGFPGRISPMMSDSQDTSVEDSEVDSSSVTTLPRAVWVVADAWLSELRFRQLIHNVATGFSLATETGICQTEKIIEEMENQPTHAVVILSSSDKKNSVLNALSKNGRLHRLLDESPQKHLFPEKELFVDKRYLFNSSQVHYVLEDGDEFAFGDWMENAVTFIHNARLQSDEHVIALMCDSQLSVRAFQVFAAYCLATRVCNHLDCLLNMIKSFHPYLLLQPQHLKELWQFARSAECVNGLALQYVGHFDKELVRMNLGTKEETEALADADRRKFLREGNALYGAWCKVASREELGEWKNLKDALREIQIHSLMDKECAVHQNMNAFEISTERATFPVYPKPDPFEDDFC